MKGLLSTVGSSLLAAALVSALPSSYDRSGLNHEKRQEVSSCEPHEVWAPREYIGTRDSGSGAKCISKWRAGVLPNKIEARADDNMLRWIKISYTDGSSTEHGNRVELDAHGRGGVVAWNPYSESFSKFEIAGGGNGGGNVGRIVLEVPSGSIDVGAYDMPDLKDIPRGNDGVLLGFEMSVGDGIDWLAPIFSDAGIARVLLLENTFSPTTQQLNDRPFDERMMTVARHPFFFTNKLSEVANMETDVTIDTQTMTKVSEVREKGSQITHGFGLSIGGKLEFSNPGPKMAGVEIGAEISYSYSDMRHEATLSGEENGKINRKAVAYRIKAPIQPGMRAICTVTVLESNVDLSFESKLQYQFKNGKKFTYEVSGRYENAAYSEATSECEERPIGDKNDGLREGGIEIDVTGAYCSNGEKVSDVLMEEEALKAACAGKSA